MSYHGTLVAEENKRREAASTMLTALIVAANAMQDALDGGDYWQENFTGNDLPLIQAAIAQAKAAGIQ